MRKLTVLASGGAFIPVYGRVRIALNAAPTALSAAKDNIRSPKGRRGAAGRAVRAPITLLTCSFASAVLRHSGLPAAFCAHFQLGLAPCDHLRRRQCVSSRPPSSSFQRLPAKSRPSRRAKRHCRARFFEARAQPCLIAYADVRL